MKSLLVYILFGLLFVSRKGGWCQEEQSDYHDDEEEDDDFEGDDSDESSNIQVSIISTPLTLEVKSGSKVVLPCIVDHPGEDVIEWYFGSTRLFMDEVKMHSDPRLNQTDDHSLIISDVNSTDSGNYTCSLVNNKKLINHTLHVSTSAEIVEFTASGDRSGNNRHIIWMKGSRQRVFCNTTGYPTPEVTLTHMWIHGNHRSKEIESLIGNPVIINPVERRHAGKYICTANNELYRTEKTLQVEVEYKPEIHMKKDYISSAEGIETEVVCRVQAHPPAEVTWLKDGAPLTGRIGEPEEDVEGASHKLKIYKTTRADFGLYTCKARNRWGNDSRSIRVSGEPSRPVILSATFDDDTITPVLTWKIHSLTPITEYMLEYKKQENNDWNELSKSPEIITSGAENNYIARHKFMDLEEGTYHARIKAKNTYGWSQLSSEKTFSGNKASLPRAANSYSHLESVRQGSTAAQEFLLAYMIQSIKKYGPKANLVALWQT